MVKPDNIQKTQHCLPCTTNFSRGDFPAITVAKSDIRTREFIFKLRRAVKPVCKMTEPNEALHRILLLRLLPLPLLPCSCLLWSLPELLRPGFCATDCWTRSYLVRLLRRQFSEEKSGCQAPPRKQKAKGECNRSTGMR